jgi:hypothetical protein
MQAPSYKPCLNLLGQWQSTLSLRCLNRDTSGGDKRAQGRCKPPSLWRDAEAISFSISAPEKRRVNSMMIWRTAKSALNGLLEVALLNICEQKVIEIRNVPANSCLKWGRSQLGGCVYTVRKVLCLPATRQCVPTIYIPLPK